MDQTGFLFSSWFRFFVEKDQSNFELCSKFVRYSESKGERWKFFYLHLDFFFQSLIRWDLFMHAQQEVGIKIIEIIKVSGFTLNKIFKKLFG